jgi:drug/metabolite transporter (DMT)-like permease
MNRLTGIRAAILSPIFLGLAPVFGRLAILEGVPPLEVVALRTVLAALLVLLTILITQRKMLYIYPAGLIGCLLAGGINGLGSLLFYSSLARINASVGQLLNSTYPLFLAIWFTLDRQPPSKLTILRLLLSVPAVYLLSQANSQDLDLVGVAMMLGAAALYALHLPINQRVLYEMPPQTVTFYTLLAMSAVVFPTYLILRPAPLDVAALTSSGLIAIIGLTVVTFLSRIALFTGVKHIGGMQTAIIGLIELLVTVLVSFIWLGERLSVPQWLGAALLMFIVYLVAYEKAPPSGRRSSGWLRWISPPGHNIEISQMP